MFNHHRTFGVEIEFVGDRNRVAEEVNRMGIECHVEGYNHFTRPHWKIVGDVSVHPTGNQTGNGAEIVSPILKGQDGFDQLKKVTKALEIAGAKVNRTCGLHVHHDAGDFETETFKNLVRLYVRYEDAIDRLVPKSRRANNNFQYCRTLMLANTHLLDDASDLTRIRVNVFNESRYYKLNLEAYVTHGTVEFRQHSGTVEYEKIENWVKLTQMMVERAVDRPVRKGKDGSWEGFKDALGCNHNPDRKVSSYDEETKAVYKFYNKRRKDLAA